MSAEHQPQRRPNLIARALTGLVRGYQLIVSPWFAPTCRYYPSCSAYAVGALQTHGAIRGLGLATWRILRCNPWSKGGVDHVPPRRGDGHEHHKERRTLMGRTQGGAAEPRHHTFDMTTERI